MNGSRVSSPSFNLDKDSGRGSSSVPSSPAKEMSPAPISLSSSRMSPVSHHYAPLNNQPDFLKTPVQHSTDNVPSFSASLGENPLCIVEDDRIRKDSLENEEENLRASERFRTAKKNESELNFEPDINVPNEVFVKSLSPAIVKDLPPPGISKSGKN